MNKETLEAFSQEAAKGLKLNRVHYYVSMEI